MCRLRASGRYGPYLRLTKTRNPFIDETALRAKEHLEGKFVVYSNNAP
jgi:hypothetical protein